MKAVTVSQMRELDRRTIGEFGVPGHVLMDRAGEGVARAVQCRLRSQPIADAPVLLVAGKGNNGGDAFAAARYLHQWGTAVRLWIAGDPAELGGDARHHWDRMVAEGIAPLVMREEKDWTGVPPPAPGTIVVDGVLGTGVNGEVRGLAAAAIERIATWSGQSRVVAIDLPSGLDADTGRPCGRAVKADVTVTFGLPKRGLLLPAASDYVGCLEVVDIGIPDALTQGLTSDVELIASAEIGRHFTRRGRDSHKGTFGTVVILGGAAGFAGAAGLAARAALRSGVGLVQVITPRGIAGVVAAMAPEAMVHAAPETDSGALADDWSLALRGMVDHADAVVVGPGMTTGEHSRRLVHRLMMEVRCPLLLDADALNVMAGNIGRIGGSGASRVITPHPGEMGRLLGMAAAAVQADRWNAAQAAAEQLKAVVVLKGAGTLVAAAGKPLCVNLTGNPGLACGGTGDVLSGLMGGMLAQGFGAWDAAQIAVHLHGIAGDLAALAKTEVAMTAGDVIEALPAAFRRLGVR
jgi:NAD(P)H-hydrate epimerase